MFAVVDHQQPDPAFQCGGHRLAYGLAGLLGDTEHRRYRVRYRCGIGYCCQFEKPGATENSVDFIKGIATAITPMAFYETVMVKGYQTLVDSDTQVDVSTGMIAACRLQALIDSRAGQPDMAHIMVQVGQIIDAVKSTVPQDMWGEIVRKLDGVVESDDRTDNEIEEFDPADDEHDPADFDEDDDI